MRNFDSELFLLFIRFGFLCLILPQRTDEGPLCQNCPLLRLSRFRPVQSILFDILNKLLEELLREEPRWGTADAEIRVVSDRNPNLFKVSSFNPGVGQNRALHTSPKLYCKKKIFLNNYSPQGPFNFISFQIFSNIKATCHEKQIRFVIS